MSGTPFCKLKNEIVRNAGKTSVKLDNASDKAGNGGILFEQRKARNDPKKFHGSGVDCFPCVVHPMKFFRVILCLLLLKKYHCHPASMTYYVMQLKIQTTFLHAVGVRSSVPE